ncbi:MAG: FHA domain-containing protein, partial [Actinobacteria bacterium]|nr:FHA domain-containing protein [Actinomycetota bacterium]
MASDPPDMPTLIVQSGPGAGQRFEVDGEVVVGRGDVDCVIDDAELSRRHIAVRATPAGIEIEDLGSLNGTWFK